MRCKHCGAEIPYGELYCKRCGEEVRIVPDYNPLDDLLEAQVKDSINSQEDNDYLNYQNVRQERSDKKSRPSASRNTRVIDEREARRRQAERRKELKRKKRRKLLIIMGIIFAVIIAGGIAVYQTSYTGIVNKGNKALKSGEFGRAQELFEKAIQKKPKNPEAYTGLSNLYIEKKDLVKAEDVFRNVIKEQPDNAALYEACFEFYIGTNQNNEIPKLLNSAEDNVQKSLKDYHVNQPEASLSDKEVYEDVQQLTLTSDSKTLYYTLDGTTPTLKSTKYKEPIQLEEGETTVKVIAVNEKDVPSLVLELNYVIELPIEDAPSVSPSTGQYDKDMEIEIKIPDGYSAYYTTDGTDPTTASKKYTGPIDMPVGNTLFKAILVNEKGRVSGVTTRNYVLEYASEDNEEEMMP